MTFLLIGYKTADSFFLFFFGFSIIFLLLRVCVLSSCLQRFTEYGVQSVLTLHDEPASQAASGVHPSVRGLRDVVRSLAKVKDQRTNPAAVHSAMEQLESLLQSSGANFE